MVVQVSLRECVVFDVLTKPWFLRLSFLAISILLFYGLFRPTPFAVPFAHADKIAHIGVFLSLGVVARLLFAKVPALGCWLVFILLAASSEYAQSWWRPFRVFSEGDVLANVIGALLALVFYWRN